MPTGVCRLFEPPNIRGSDIIGFLKFVFDISQFFNGEVIRIIIQNEHQIWILCLNISS